jgi:monoamine oxidase
MDAIIIGAGLSGLTCAYELATAGHKVKIFESRDRIGGRVHSRKDFAIGKNVEFGGELIGSNHPHIISYAQKFNLELMNVSNNNLPSPAIFKNQKMVHEQFKDELKIIFELMNDASININVDEPWNSPNAIQLDNTPVSDWISKLNISDMAKHIFGFQLEADNAVPLHKQSLLANLTLCKGGGFEKFWEESESYRIKGGNQQLAFEFAKRIGHEKILLNHQVDSISDVVNCRGTRHAADVIILAIPPSVWHNIKFIPELPNVLTPQMGMNTKHLSLVNGGFWKGVSPNSWGDRHINQTWSGTDGQDESDESALVSFSGSDSAMKVHESEGSEVLKELEEFYPNINNHVTKTYLVDWIADIWTRCGYSFPAPGEITKIGPILKNGIGNLQFAGEHTCYQFVGYMEGAVCSGASLANRLKWNQGESNS